MHNLNPLITDLAIILVIASIVTLLFQKIRQPVVLGYLVAGAIVGPHTPPHSFISNSDNIKVLSELGIIFLMFSLGLEFSFHKLKRVGFSASITGFIEVIGMVLIGLATGTVLGWSFYNSLFLGAALAISSTTIIIKAFEELKLKNKRFAELVFGILIVEDLLAILLLVGLSTVVATQNIVSIDMLWATLKLIIVVGGWFLIGYFFVPLLFRHIAAYASEETLTIVSIALCLLLVSIAAYFDYSVALGAFIMGSIIAETPLVHRLEKLIRPIRDIFAAVFFVSVGMLIDPKMIWHHLPLILFLCLVTVVGKLFITSFAALLTGQSVKTSLRIGFSMGQIGEFSFIIAGLGLALHATDSKLYPIIVAVSAITTFTTPYLINWSGKLSDQLDNHLPVKAKYHLENYSAWVYKLLANKKQSSIYRRAFAQFIINGVIVGAIFTLIQHYLLPKIAAGFDKNWIVKILDWLATLLIASPFIWGMLAAFKKHYKIMLFISWSIVVLEILFLSIVYFDTWLISVSLAIIALIFFGLLYKQLDKSYQWFEKKLIDNLNFSSRQYNRYEELAPWETHLIEIELGRYSELFHKPLHVHQLRQRFGINIVAIYRGTNVILSPRSDEVIMPFDKLIVLGNDEQIEQFIATFVRDQPQEQHDRLLENFSLKAFTIGSESPLLGKSIHNSGIREQTHGLVVGLERAGKRILNPDSSVILAARDVLFIVGESKAIENLKV